MSFVEIVDRVTRLLKDQVRISYRTLQREFSLDEAALEDLKEELIHSKQVARDENGKVLIWNARPRPKSDFEKSAVDTDMRILDRSLTGHQEDSILVDRAAVKSLDTTSGERKTVTSLFADLKGSTALIEGMDPEDARALLDPILQLMMEAVHHYDGYVAQTLGDGIFALFGAPIAHEDHPQRALHAALRMQEAMRRYSGRHQSTGGMPLQMRVGVNTGEVVVRCMRRDDWHTDYIPVGYPTNLAARLEQNARPGSIVVSENTQKLTDGYFELKGLGARAIDGVGEPLNLFEVIGTGPLRTRLEVVARRGLTRFVGRKSELRRLRQALKQSMSGHGQIVELVGEPGLGKSRLFYEFKLAVPSDCLMLEAISVSHGKPFSYLPLIELLKGYFQLDPSDDQAARRLKITDKVHDLDPKLNDVIPYILLFLDIEAQDSTLRQMDPEIRRHRKFEALKRLFLRESLSQPLVLIFEDLHWLDQGTLDFIDALVADVSPAKILLLLNYRPEYRHDRKPGVNSVSIQLAPLGKSDIEELLLELLGTHESLVRLKPFLLEKTQGTPFFLEEAVQTLSEEGVLIGHRGCYRLHETPRGMRISPTVQGVLAARIDRLTNEEKELLQRLSIIGRQFSLTLVKRVITWPTGTLEPVLASLQQKEFLYEVAALPETHYSFKHALTHDLAYGSVLQKQRKILHEKTAQVLEARYNETMDGHYGELAYHYRHSDNTEKAVMYLGLAGQQASQRSAFADAIDYLEEAIALLKKMTASPERNQQELTFQVTLAASIGASRGYGSAEVEIALNQARALCSNAHRTPQLSPVLYALRRLHTARGDLEKADELANQHLALARHLDDEPVLLAAHMSGGISSSGLGDFSRAKSNFEKALALYDRQRHPSLAALYGDDPGTLSNGYFGLLSWVLGYPDQAVRLIQESLRNAENLQYPLGLAWAQLFAAVVHQYRREPALTLNRAENVVALSQSQGFPLFSAAGMITLGWCLVQKNDDSQGIALIQDGLEKYRTTGVKFWHPYFVSLQSETYLKTGHNEKALSSLADALVEIRESGERQHEPELYRLQGRLILQANGHRLPSTVKSSACVPPRIKSATAAEDAFQKALALARQQSAKSWELRAGTDLARLWIGQGKSAEAYAMLQPIYSWFDEGFDTPDLIEARFLLENLEHA